MEDVVPKLYPVLCPPVKVTSKFLRSCIVSTSFQIILSIWFIFGVQIAIEDVVPIL